MKFSPLKKQSGQVVVEYVLLLAIGVSLAIAFITMMIKTDSNPEDSGALIKKWHHIQKDIGEDTQN